MSIDLDPTCPITKRFLQDLKLNGKSERTQRSYCRSVRKFAEFLRHSPEQQVAVGAQPDRRVEVLRQPQLRALGGGAEAGDVVGTLVGRQAPPGRVELQQPGVDEALVGQMSMPARSQRATSGAA
jgi:hypothetical protein